ncbi:MAG: DUF4390 domain-containing protein [Betaproteobacteria bacterium]|nr:DUF4390 domain-containing protein [Betaproteobacteria bacterium]MCX7195526.1 DUF4390 domain-containing protein [Pseudomonadota bacterium]
MHYCKSMHNLARLLALLLALWLGISVACAEGISVRKTEARFSDGSYQFSADFDISLNFVVDQALTRGVPLYFISEFSLIRPRWYWMDEVIVKNEQTTKLSYNKLTRQYRITRGSLFQNFSSLGDALRIISHQSAAPIDAALLQKNDGYISSLLPQKGDYIAATRMRLDVTQLPKPLQVNALATQDWNFDSNWYRWVVRPIISAADRESE